MQTKARRKDLDCAKGLGILLVVAGHLVSGATDPPIGNVWYIYLRAAVYEFHMPFFMYLSGYVTFLSGAAATGLEQWPTLVRKRAYRLLLPFFVFGLFIVAGKWLASQMFHVDKMPSSMTDALFGLVWDTDKSPVASVWYVAVLFVFCVATPLFLRLTRYRTWPLLVFAAIVYFFPVPHVLYLNRVCSYYVFFMVGGLSSEHEETWLGWMDRYFFYILAVFAVVVMAFPLPQTRELDWQIKMLIAGLLSMPALHGLVRRPVLRESSALLYFGLFSFVIYLLNTPCIGLIKGVLLKWMPWDGVNFLLFAPLLMLGGTYGPILIKKYLFRRLPAIDRITD